jgi:hypothetical protein
MWRYCRMLFLYFSAQSYYWRPDDNFWVLPLLRSVSDIIFFFFFRWRYSPLLALACWKTPLHFPLSITTSLHLLTPNTWRSLSTSSLYPFLGLPLCLVPSSSWAKIFLCILSSSILSRWPSQLIFCPFIHFTIFSPLHSCASSRFVLLFHSPSSYLAPYLLTYSMEQSPSWEANK